MYTAVCSNTKTKSKENGNYKEKCHCARNGRSFSFCPFAPSPPWRRRLLVHQKHHQEMEPASVEMQKDEILEES